MLKALATVPLVVLARSVPTSNRPDSVTSPSENAVVLVGCRAESQWRVVVGARPRNDVVVRRSAKVRYFVTTTVETGRARQEQAVCRDALGRWESELRAWEGWQKEEEKEEGRWVVRRVEGLWSGSLGFWLMVNGVVAVVRRNGDCLERDVGGCGECSGRTDVVRTTSTATCEVASEVSVCVIQEMVVVEIVKVEVVTAFWHTAPAERSKARQCRLAYCGCWQGCWARVVLDRAASTMCRKSLRSIFSKPFVVC
nr:hypothetical protein CFP56_29963 [Quercus suber]